ncbi:MAG: RpiB/LacA/LacB family sugar-phosphate isomerase [Candidatus Pacebacteria bacterium]|nr:RpiB/LacA/LacB family sugar-phosphate isomerase [Candidatus Paceibacterota bacterium]
MMKIRVENSNKIGWKMIVSNRVLLLAFALVLGAFQVVADEAGTSPEKTIVIGSVNKAFELKSALVEHLRKQGHEVVDVGCHAADEFVKYPELGESVAKVLYDGRADFGIVCCNFGCSAASGVSKFKGVVAFPCESVKTAVMSRKANDTNVMCLGQSVVSSEQACEMADAFIATRFLDIPNMPDRMKKFRIRARDMIRTRGEVPKLELLQCVPAPTSAGSSKVKIPQAKPTKQDDAATGSGLSGDLTLRQCIDLALANNPGISGEEWRAHGMEAARDAAWAERLPELSASSSYTFYREERLIKPRRTGDINALSFADELATAEVVLELPLYTGGRLVNEVAAAELLSESARRRLAYSREELVFNVSSLFYSMLEQREVIKSLEFSRRALERHSQTTEEMMAVQKAARVDLLRTEVRLADIEQQLLRERDQLKVQRFALAGLLGLEDDADKFDIAGELDTVEVQAEAESAVARALMQRQDYLAAKSWVDAQQRKLWSAKGARLPKVTMQAAYGNQWGVENSDANEVGELGIRVYMPLYTGGGISADIARHEHLLRAAEEELRGLQLRIRVEVQSALANIESARARLGVTGKFVDRAEESLRIEQEKYGLAKGSITDVLDAQADALLAQTNHHRALADYNIALARYKLVTGDNYRMTE